MHPPPPLALPAAALDDEDSEPPILAGQQQHDGGSARPELNDDDYLDPHDRNAAEGYDDSDEDDDEALGQVVIGTDGNTIKLVASKSLPTSLSGTRLV